MQVASAPVEIDWAEAPGTVTHKLTCGEVEVPPLQVPVSVHVAPILQLGESVHVVTHEPLKHEVPDGQGLGLEAPVTVHGPQFPLGVQYPEAHTPFGVEGEQLT